MRSARQHCDSHITHVPKKKLFVVAAFIALFFIISLTIGNWPLPKAPQSAVISHSDVMHDADNTTDEHDLHGMQHLKNISANVPVPFLSPWGDNRLAVFREWVYIYRSIRADIQRLDGTNNPKGEPVPHNSSPGSGRRIQVLVYDVNDGYFTLSLIKFLPEMFVTSVVFDKCRHSAKKTAECPSPVQLSENIEKMWKELRKPDDVVSDPPLSVCVSPEMSLLRLGGIGSRHTLADYQIAVSLFDHFTLTPTKATFQRLLIAVLKSASVATFISLPRFRAPIKRKPNQPPRWYESALDPEELIKEAANSFSLQVSVTPLVSVWRSGGNQSVLRVEVLRNSKEEAGENMQCNSRRKILRCTSQGHFARCP
ncbi:hypothetical protein DQ04_00091140 [Trypanosoma grayi]|uniref:hypothetical protein n=1 Tax=Trypanosoma grayi TaxID=71804 RepID=UPI0004F3EFEE|nr:hypothetical protein DQ04_00091140 [Trypanosoma grayi]KEG15380.1 hypothetical protein DQ04_00091140 [Trypanosoma grayi]